MGGGLYDPLGTDRTDGSRRPRPSGSTLLLGAIALAVTALVVAAVMRDDGDRGEPRATATIVPVVVAPVPAVALPPPPPAVAAGPAQPAGSSGVAPPRDDQEVEIQNGVRIIRPRRDQPVTGGRTVGVPQPGGTAP